MHLREIQFTGYFEEQDLSSSETLQIVAPDNQIEQDILAWTLLPGTRTVKGDPARQGYSFIYELGKPLSEGIFALTVTGRDASNREHAVEIAAAVVAISPTGDARDYAFAPFWLLSESIHFKPLRKMSDDQYHGAAYGHLRFEGSADLPHRRLFGATV